LDATIWRGRSDLIAAPEEVRVLMASIAEHVMDGSEEIRWAMRSRALCGARGLCASD